MFFASTIHLSTSTYCNVVKHPSGVHNFLHVAEKHLQFSVRMLLTAAANNWIYDNIFGERVVTARLFSAYCFCLCLLSLAIDNNVIKTYRVSSATKLRYKLDIQFSLISNILQIYIYYRYYRIYYWFYWFPMEIWHPGAPALIYSSFQRIQKWFLLLV